MRRVDLANWALRTSPKFITGVKYQFHQGFWPDQWSGNPNLTHTHTHTHKQTNTYTHTNTHTYTNTHTRVCVCVCLLILQPFRHFTYDTTHFPTLPSLYLRHSSFSNHSVASPTSQFIFQPFFRFSCVTSSSLNSPGEPPMLSFFVWYLPYTLRDLKLKILKPLYQMTVGEARIMDRNTRQIHRDEPPCIYG